MQPLSSFHHLKEKIYGDASLLRSHLVIPRYSFSFIFYFLSDFIKICVDLKEKKAANYLQKQIQQLAKMLSGGIIQNHRLIPYFWYVKTCPTPLLLCLCNLTTKQS